MGKKAEIEKRRRPGCREQKNAVKCSTLKFQVESLGKFNSYMLRRGNIYHDTPSTPS